MAKSDQTDQHKRLAMGESIEGEPGFGCEPCCHPVKGKRAADTTGSQKLPGFPGPLDPPYK